MIENEHLVERSAKLGKQAKAFFDKMKDKFDFIGDVRIYGLNGGIDIVDPATGKADDDAATQLITQIFELGALMITVRGNILRFQPPLVIKETDLNKAFSIIEQAMQELNDGKLPPAKPMGW